MYSLNNYFRVKRDRVKMKEYISKLLFEFINVTGEVRVQCAANFAGFKENNVGLLLQSSCGLLSILPDTSQIIFYQLLSLKVS